MVFFFISRGYSPCTERKMEGCQGRFSSPGQNTTDKKKEATKMDNYVCDLCGYVYDPSVGDPDGGISPGTSFEDLPDDWVCPVCGAGKEDFSKE